MDKLASGWEIANVADFVVRLLFYGLAIRAALAVIRAPQIVYEQDGKLSDIPKFAWQSFWGFAPKEQGIASADYWHPYLLGVFELSAYSVLIATGAWNAIGAWLGLKTIAQFKVWTENRATFNVFLIGNLMVLAVALLFLAPMVEVR